MPKYVPKFKDYLIYERLTLIACLLIGQKYLYYSFILI